MHKVWRSIEEVPYCFSRSSIKFHGHTGGKLTIWIQFEITWPVAAIKSLRFALFKVICEISRPHKANLGDLIAATGLVIFLKFDSNHTFFCLCDLEIWWMTLKNNKAPLLQLPWPSGQVTGLPRGRSWVRSRDAARGVIPHGCSPYHTNMAWSSVWHRSNMSRSQLYLGFGHFGWIPSFFGNNILAGLWWNCISSVEITLFLLADILLQHRALFQC